MEAPSSSNTAYLMIESVVDNQGYDSVGGRKSEEIVADLVEVSSDEASSDELSLEDTEDYHLEEREDSDLDDSEDEDSDEEEEEEDNERRNIFKDLFKLKKLADFFQHPEKPVEVDCCAAGRSYFSRPDAADTLSEDGDEVLADALALKQSAGVYLHPERTLEVDATAFARNYFSQPWASEQETFGKTELRARLLEESRLLKEHAATYNHPEAPIDMQPGMSMARNYFMRASAPEPEDADQAQVLEDMKALKHLASAYLHPEKPLEIDANGCGRNYFTRPSAPEQEEDEYGDEREIILEEMQELKQAASDFMHPERLIEIDTTGARSYFDRSSAPEQDVEESELILQEMQALKKLAVFYLHPEKPLEVDATACARNYFSRSSAPEQEEDDYGDDREIILEEMQELKKVASDYLHPEKPLEIDAMASARNYFSRPSAAEQEEDDYGDDRDIILEEMQELKQLASDYLHPEKPIEMDPTSFGRNYFGRASAPEYEGDEYASNHERVHMDAALLYRLAVDYRHPERPVLVDSAAFARNYYGRSSADDQDSFAQEELALVLQEAAQLKKVASTYMHPEKPLEVDQMSFGRNYYGRASAPVSVEETERTQVLAEASALKKLAVDYRHPEIPVKTSDPAALGRNYFTRASAAGASEHISSSGHANQTESVADEHSQHDEYGHFEMDEEIFYDMRQSIVLPLAGDAANTYVPKFQSSKISSDEEGELSRSPSSVMLFTGALESHDHPPLPSMG